MTFKKLSEGRCCTDPVKKRFATSCCAGHGSIRQVEGIWMKKWWLACESDMDTEIRDHEAGRHVSLSRNACMKRHSSRLVGRNNPFRKARGRKNKLGRTPMTGWHEYGTVEDNISGGRGGQGRSKGLALFKTISQRAPRFFFDLQTPLEL